MNNLSDLDSTILVDEQGITMKSRHDDDNHCYQSRAIHKYSKYPRL